MHFGQISDSDSPDLKQISTLGGDELPPSPPEALFTLLAGSPLTAKAEEGDQLRWKYLIVEVLRQKNSTNSAQKDQPEFNEIFVSKENPTDLSYKR